MYGKWKCWMMEYIRMMRRVVMKKGNEDWWLGWGCRGWRNRVYKWREWEWRRNVYVLIGFWSFNIWNVWGLVMGFWLYWWRMYIVIMNDCVSCLGIYIYWMICEYCRVRVFIFGVLELGLLYEVKEEWLKGLDVGVYVYC